MLVFSSSVLHSVPGEGRGLVMKWMGLEEIVGGVWCVCVLRKSAERLPGPQRGYLLSRE